MCSKEITRCISVEVEEYLVVGGYKYKYFVLFPSYVIQKNLSYTRFSSSFSFSFVWNSHLAYNSLNSILALFYSNKHV